jgi:hypothetical protein
MIKRALVSILLLAAAAGAVACNDDCDCPDCDPIPEPDGGVGCESEPSACADIGATEEEQFFGCCFEGAVYWCDGGALKSIACEDNGYLCGYSTAGDFVDCV